MQAKRSTIMSTQMRFDHIRWVQPCIVEIAVEGDKTMRVTRPSHPGQFIRMEVIEPLNLTVTKAAQFLGVTRPALSALLNCRAALSPEMALRIEKAFGPKMDTLLRMQTAYNVAEVRRRAADIKVKRYVACLQPPRSFAEK